MDVFYQLARLDTDGAEVGLLKLTMKRTAVFPSIMFGTEQRPLAGRRFNYQFLKSHN